MPGRVAVPLPFSLVLLADSRLTDQSPDNTLILCKSEFQTGCADQPGEPLHVTARSSPAPTPPLKIGLHFAPRVSVAFVQTSVNSWRRSFFAASILAAIAAAD
jgi:hypothetical protein